MGRWHTREELYEILWSEPVSKVAPRYGISDVALRKKCAQARIPIPERGYWAKLRYRETVPRTELPLRGPGMSGQVYIGRSGWPDKSENSPFEDESLPVFPDDIEELAVNTAKLVGNPRVPTLANRTHPVVAKLIEEDARRHAESSSQVSGYSSRQPRFNAPIDQRRLRIANAIFLTLARLEAAPGTREHEGELEFGAAVGNTWVPITIISTAPKSPKGAPSKQQRLVVSVPVKGIPGCRDGTWNDSQQPIERQIGEIVTGVIVAGELLHRVHEQEWYERWMEHKRWLEEEDRKRQFELQRREQERQRAEAQARIDRLLAEAQQFRLASDIRAYVSAARQTNHGAIRPIGKESFEAWAAWAIAQADRIDPVLSGEFAKEIRKQD